MRILHTAAIAFAGLAIAASTAAFAQLPEPIGKHDDKAFGYVDLKTGIFHKMTPDVSASPELTPVTPTYVTGTIDVTFDVTVDSTFPSGTVIYCDAEVVATSIYDGSTTLLPYVATYTELGVGHVASGASGKSVICSVSIPYSWAVAPATLKPTNTYTVTHTVIAVNPTVTSTAGTITETGVLRQSTSSQVQSGVIPATGTITKLSAYVTI
jgi:hypothetical protein